jgi:hypothetical protein
MVTLLQPSPRCNAAKSTMRVGNPPTARPSWCRPLRVGLALYLLPALLAVIFVGVIGILLLAAGRCFTDIVGSQACHPRNPVELEVFRS